jgi:hypothetical protein
MFLPSRLAVQVLLGPRSTPEVPSVRRYEPKRSIYRPPETVAPIPKKVEELRCAVTFVDV